VEGCTRCALKRGYDSEWKEQYAAPPDFGDVYDLYNVCNGRITTTGATATTHEYDASGKPPKS
jgi:hypothetical protein